MAKIISIAIKMTTDELELCGSENRALLNAVAKSRSSSQFLKFD
jgi:hypothetical protein